MYYRISIATALISASLSAFALGGEIDAAKLIGDWKYVSGVRGGEEVPAERLAGNVKITAETFVVPSGEEQPFVMAYTLHPQTNPVGIDFKITAGPVPEGNALGIIKMEDGKLVLCYDPTGQNRPKAFASTEEKGEFLFWMEPIKNE